MALTSVERRGRYIVTTAIDIRMADSNALMNVAMHSTVQYSQVDQSEMAATAAIALILPKSAIPHDGYFECSDVQ